MKETKRNVRLVERIKKDKEMMKRIDRVSHYSPEQFVSDALRYISAIREGRMINSIGHVSRSGMSRTLCFMECNRREKGRYQYFQFMAFFMANDFTRSKADDGYFTIGGCGMDMIFHTNYTIIHRMYRLGFISRKVRDRLAQMTPTTI